KTPDAIRPVHIAATAAATESIGRTREVGGEPGMIDAEAVDDVMHIRILQGHNLIDDVRELDGGIAGEFRGGRRGFEAFVADGIQLAEELFGSDFSHEINLC